ncbi:hypothetical protein [uncultured Alistipes sp.]|uniref:hypothetical protein n=1 Tax=uncultured Alistipes sp. TaxID=538949 RepID=UPI0025D656FC|nr:hypothetical protein [uncultured Alistipes sp.]
MEQGVKVGTLSRVKHRLTGWRGRLVRMRHFRGHGVHSPFVYAIVRQVLMRRTLLGADTSLRDALLRAGVGMRRATELQNLMTHCGYRTFALAACAAEAAEAAGELVVLLRGCGGEATVRAVRAAALRGATAVVAEPRADAARERMCRMLVAEHPTTTVDMRTALLLFNNGHLPKQHFEL